MRNQNKLCSDFDESVLIFLFFPPFECLVRFASDISSQAPRIYHQNHITSAHIPHQTFVERVHPKRCIRCTQKKGLHCSHCTVQLMCAIGQHLKCHINLQFDFILCAGIYNTEQYIYLQYLTPLWTRRRWIRLGNWSNILIAVDFWIASKVWCA